MEYKQHYHHRLPGSPWSETVVHHATEMVVHHATVEVVHFTPKYSILISPI